MTLLWSEWASIALIVVMGVVYLVLERRVEREHHRHLVREWARSRGVTLPEDR